MRSRVEIAWRVWPTLDWRIRRSLRSSKFGFWREGVTGLLDLEEGATASFAGEGRHRVIIFFLSFLISKCSSQSLEGFL